MEVLLAFLALAAIVNGQSECNDARVQFEGMSAECLRAFEGAATLDSNATDLVCNNTACQASIETYVGACISNQSINKTTVLTRDISAAGLVHMWQLVEQVLRQQLISMLRCIPTGTPDDEICFNVTASFSGGFDTVFSSLGMLTNLCIAEYLMGVCSENCMQVITTLTEELGCCYSEAVRVFSSLATNQFEADTSLGILTRDYFNLCGMNQPMFCQDRTIPAPSACVVAVQTLFGNEECSVIARQLMAGSDILTNNIPNPTCIANLLEYAASCNVSLDNVGQCEMSAFDLLGRNDDCANSIFTIASNLSIEGSENISFNVVDRASNNLCGVTGCRERVLTFADDCLPANLSEMYDAFVVDLGCHVNDRGSCFAAQQSGLLTELTTAFNSGSCTLAIFGDCSSICSPIIRSAVEVSGCCVFEFAQAILKTFPVPGGIEVNINDVFRGCGVPNPGECAEQTEGTFRQIDDNSTTDDPNDNVGGASITMAYTIFCSLLSLLTLIIVL